MTGGPPCHCFSFGKAANGSTLTGYSGLVRLYLYNSAGPLAGGRDGAEDIDRRCTGTGMAGLSRAESKQGVRYAGQRTEE